MIDIQVRNAEGRIVAQGAQKSAIDFHLADGTKYPLLRTILPWDDTMFEQRQVADLLLELDRFALDEGIEPAVREVQWFRDLCHLALADPERVLWTVGD